MCCSFCAAGAQCCAHAFGLHLCICAPPTHQQDSNVERFLCILGSYWYWYFADELDKHHEHHPPTHLQQISNAMKFNWRWPVSLTHGMMHGVYAAQLNKNVWQPLLLTLRSAGKQGIHKMMKSLIGIAIWLMSNANIVHQQNSNANFRFYHFMDALSSCRTECQQQRLWNISVELGCIYAMHNPMCYRHRPASIKLHGIANLLMVRGRVMFIVLVQIISKISMSIASQNAKEALDIAILLTSRGCTNA